MGRLAQLVTHFLLLKFNKENFRSGLFEISKSVVVKFLLNLEKGKKDGRGKWGRENAVIVLNSGKSQIVICNGPLLNIIARNQTASLYIKTTKLVHSIALLCGADEPSAHFREESFYHPFSSSKFESFSFSVHVFGNVLMFHPSGWLALFILNKLFKPHSPITVNIGTPLDIETVLWHSALLCINGM
jgi:hypothetical protein